MTISTAIHHPRYAQRAHLAYTEMRVRITMRGATSEMREEPSAHLREESSMRLRKESERFLREEWWIPLRTEEEPVPARGVIRFLRGGGQMSKSSDRDPRIPEHPNPRISELRASPNSAHLRTPRISECPNPRIPERPNPRIPERLNPNPRIPERFAKETVMIRDGLQLIAKEFEAQQREWGLAHDDTTHGADGLMAAAGIVIEGFDGKEDESSVPWAVRLHKKYKGDLVKRARIAGALCASAINVKTLEIGRQHRTS